MADDDPQATQPFENTQVAATQAPQFATDDATLAFEPSATQTLDIEPEDTVNTATQQVLVEPIREEIAEAHASDVAEEIAADPSSEEGKAAGHLSQEETKGEPFTNSELEATTVIDDSVLDTLARLEDEDGSFPEFAAPPAVKPTIIAPVVPVSSAPSAEERQAMLRHTIFGDDDDDDDDGAFEGFDIPVPAEVFAPHKSDKDRKKTSKHTVDDDVIDEKAAQKRKRKDTGAAPEHPLLSATDGSAGKPEEVEDDSNLTEFQKLMKRRKEALGKKDKKGEETLREAEDVIARLRDDMIKAAEEDIIKNEQGRPATAKINMLKRAVQQLRIVPHYELLIENGMLSAVAAWLEPLPDRSLPNLSLRTELFRWLHDIPYPGTELLKESKIGRICMNLSKHPQETPENKKTLSGIIEKWARQIHGRVGTYTDLTPEERERRDVEEAAKLPQRTFVRQRDETAGEKTLMAGEKGFVSRARVPQITSFDYVVRPKSIVKEEDMEHNAKRKKSSALATLEKECTKPGKGKKTLHAIRVNISGSFSGSY